VAVVTLLGYVHHGVGGLVTYLWHYFVARGVFQMLRGHGVSSGAIVVIGLAVGVAWWLLHRRRRSAGIWR
jgi:hypothetical protein